MEESHAVAILPARGPGVGRCIAESIIPAIAFPAAFRRADSVRQTPVAMEMKRLTGGNLRSAGYDDKNRVLVVELSSGTFQYSGVTAETWRRFAGASSPWSFFRDNIEEDYPAKRIR
jgi:KTSC domain